MTQPSGPIRVRRLITQLNYPELVLSGVVPNLEMFTPPLPSKRYPPWVYNLSKERGAEFFSEFGLFVEEVVYTTFVGGKMDYPALWSKGSASTPPTELLTNNNFIGGIIGWIRSIFPYQHVHHGYELQHGDVAGHPD